MSDIIQCVHCNTKHDYGGESSWTCPCCNQSTRWRWVEKSCKRQLIESLGTIDRLRAELAEKERNLESITIRFSAVHKAKKQAEAERDETRAEALALKASFCSTRLELNAWEKIWNQRRLEEASDE